MKYIRLNEQVRVLWIDALCINQQDVSERNHQVSQMGRIYQSATGVLAWLGLLDDSSIVAIEYLSEFGMELEELRRLNTDAFDIYKKIKAITSFCTRDYWSRLWIIQELVVASRVTLHCGTWSSDWALISSFVTNAGGRIIVPRTICTLIEIA